MRLAIDPSLNGTGIAIGEKDKILHIETISIKKLKGMERVNHIISRIKTLISEYKISEVIIEGYSFGSRGRALFQLGELGGVIRFELYKQGIKLTEVPPTSLKKIITGKGNAKKEEMLEEINRITKLGLTDHNQADAVGLLLTN